MPTQPRHAALPSLLCAISIGLAPGIRLSAHAQEPPTPATGTSPLAASRCAVTADAGTSAASDMRVPGGCLLGATLGTFIFPGLGTALGCAGFGAVSWGWGKLTQPARPAATMAQACTASSPTPVASR